MDILFGRYHRRVLALLLRRPGESFYVREIARLADVPPGSLHRELKALAEADLLRREEVGNQVRYSANTEAPIFPELAGIFRKTVGLADVLREALAPLSADIDFAFVFGSVAQGKEGVTSDIDVFVVGAVTFEQVVHALRSSHERLGREVNPVVIPLPDFKKKAAQGERFVARVIKEPKIFIIGTANDLRKLTKDRSAKGSRH